MLSTVRVGTCASTIRSSCAGTWQKRPSATGPRRGSSTPSSESTGQWRQRGTEREVTVQAQKFVTSRRLKVFHFCRSVLCSNEAPHTPPDRRLFTVLLFLTTMHIMFPLKLILMLDVDVVCGRVIVNPVFAIVPACQLFFIRLQILRWFEIFPTWVQPR